MAFDEARKWRADSMIVINNNFNYRYRADLLALAIKYRLSSICGFAELAEAGGLVSYSASIIDQYRRAASFVDRLLKGAKAAELPFEEPTKFELVVNMKTAKALGIKVPQSILVRADRVIE